MDTDDIQQKLETAGLVLKERRRSANDMFDQLVFKSGEIVNIYDTGTVVAQGKNRDEVNKILALDSAAGGNKKKRSQKPKIFVVYGHDPKAKAELEAMLRRWELEPLILDQLPSEGQTIIEKLEKYTNEDVQFAVILATPDDEGYARGKPDEKKFRARQNVVLELGLLLSKLGRARVAILLKNQQETERPSDIQGLIYFPFNDNVEETKVYLAKEMSRQGLRITVKNL